MVLERSVPLLQQEEEEFGPDERIHGETHNANKKLRKKRNKNGGYTHGGYGLGRFFCHASQTHLHLFTFMHLADAFIQSDLHCIQVTVFTFYQLLLSLGIEPMILALLAPCSTI